MNIKNLPVGTFFVSKNKHHKYHPDVLHVVKNDDGKIIIQRFSYKRIFENDEMTIQTIDLTQPLTTFKADGKFSNYESKWRYFYNDIYYEEETDIENWSYTIEYEKYDSDCGEW
jgi:hypothetical protein